MERNFLRGTDGGWYVPSAVILSDISYMRLNRPVGDLEEEGTEIRMPRERKCSGIPGLFAGDYPWGGGIVFHGRSLRGAFSPPRPLRNFHL